MTSPSPITWDNIVEMYRKLSKQYCRDVTIVDEAAWRDVLSRSSDVEREALESLRANGNVVVSPHLPEGLAGYRYTPPVDVPFQWTD